MNKQKGYTIIELLFAVAFFTILVFWGVIMYVNIELAWAAVDWLKKQ